LGVELVYGDITDMDSLKKAVEDVDVVYHLVGLLGQWGIPDKVYWDINFKGTENILKACINKNIKKFIHCSSAGVLGAIKNPPADESYPYNPSNIYERTKAEAEKLILKYHHEQGLPVIIIRPEFVYGPGDMHVLGLFKAIQKKRFFIIGDGNSTLHPTYIDDLIHGLILCMDKQRAIGEIYIIAGERLVTVKELADIIAEELNVSLSKIHIPIWLANMCASALEKIGKISKFDPPLTKSRVKFFTENRAFRISKANIELGYKPIQLMTGIKQSIDWYKENGYLDREEIQVSSIKSLYLTALLEGEGLGTAYEYFAKWRILMKIFRKIGYPKNVLVAGLPEKYGSSMDFVLFAQKYNLNITIVDDRGENINKFKKILELAKEKDDCIEITEIDRLSDLKLNLKEKYDLLLCCEVLQRLSEEERTKYFNQIGEIAENALIFVPNKENRSHAKLSGLNALNLNELSNYCQRYDIIDKGYVDMPPFPPGLKRSEEDRQKVTESFLQKSFMKTLELWAGSEVIFPKIFKRRFSHIIYCGIACNT